MAKAKAADRIHEKLLDIIEQTGYTERDDITANASLVDDLGFDDLDIIEFVMDLEESFTLTIDEATAESWKTVGDVEVWLRKQSVKL